MDEFENTLFDELPEESTIFNILPICERVLARTIGQDLVPVQPIQTAPMLDLLYMDFKYNDFWSEHINYDPDTFFNDDTFEDYK
jgi:hypothetical protein